MSGLPLRIRIYSTSVKIALFSAMVPRHALSSHLAKSTVSGHAQYKNKPAHGIPEDRRSTEIFRRFRANRARPAYKAFLVHHNPYAFRFARSV